MASIGLPSDSSSSDEEKEQPKSGNFMNQRVLGEWSCDSDEDISPLEASLFLKPSDSDENHKHSNEICSAGSSIVVTENSQHHANSFASTSRCDDDDAALNSDEDDSKLLLCKLN